MSKTTLAVVLTIAATILIATPAVQSQTSKEAGDTVELRLKPLPDGVKKMRIEQADDGSHWVIVTTTEGRQERLRPDEFVARIDRDTRGRRFLYRLLNITSPVGVAWVLLGLFGQVAFAGRMVFQWLVSEKQKRSVVPVGFWWMSLIGASMMLVYFVWRRDIIGVLGQSTGWMIYLRNLWLIHREGPGIVIDAGMSVSLRLTAYHEAGHAVMAQLCGQQITEVEIIGDDDHAGSVQSLRFAEEHSSDHDPAIPTAPIERRMLCTAAGMVAEAMISGNSIWDESCEDLDAAVRLAMQVVGDCERVLPYLEIVRDHTERLLRMNWGAVELLATTLLEERRMSGEDVRKLLGPLLPS